MLAAPVVMPELPELPAPVVMLVTLSLFITTNDEAESVSSNRGHDRAILFPVLPEFLLDMGPLTAVCQ